MRYTMTAMLTVLALSAPRAALAWDGPGLWYADAAGSQPGGGGLIGTGSPQDHYVTCADCHTGAQSQIDVKFVFTPSLPTVGGQPTYSPGQTYKVDVTLVGEHLGKSGCDQYTSNINNFAAAFADGSGKTAGTLASDSGESAASCKSTAPQPPSGTTIVYGDCHAVMASGKPDVTAWTFSWTAPQGGAGAVNLYYGAVDGNCDMMSMNDDVKVGAMKLGEATAVLAPPKQPGRGTRMAALAALLPVGIVMLRRRRSAVRERRSGRWT